MVDLLFDSSNGSDGSSDLTTCQSLIPSPENLIEDTSNTVQVAQISS